MNQVLQHLF